MITSTVPALCTSALHTPAGNTTGHPLWTTADELAFVAHLEHWRTEHCLRARRVALLRASLAAMRRQQTYGGMCSRRC